MTSEEKQEVKTLQTSHAQSKSCVTFSNWGTCLSTAPSIVLSYLTSSSWHCIAQSKCNFHLQSHQICREEVYQHHLSKILLCISQHHSSLFPYVLRMQKHELLMGHFFSDPFFSDFQCGDSGGSSLDVGQQKRQDYLLYDASHWRKKTWLKEIGPPATHD